MALQFRHADQVYVSAFKKESTWDTAETVEAASGYSLSEFEASLSYDQTRRDGQGEGTEMGSEGYISRRAYTLSLTFPFVRPHDLAFMAAFGLGTTSATADGASYCHNNNLITTALIPSFSVVLLEAGVQKILTGCAINSFSISRSGDYWSGTCEILGSRIATNADSFPAEVSEEPLLYGNTNIWLESGANVDITAEDSQAQGAENISASTPTNITADVTGDMTITVNNNLRSERGFDAPNSSDATCRGQLHRGAKREVTAEWTQTFESDALSYTLFEGSSNVQTHVALEVNQKETAQGVIAGTTYYGFIAIIPRAVFEVLGSSADDVGVITRNLKLIAKTPTTADEGAGAASQPIQLYVYNGQATFMA